jgi:hypothetical protein
MENVAILLIVVTLLLLVIILGLLTLLIYKLMKNGNPAQTGNNSLINSSTHPEILARIKDLDKVKPKRAELFCPNHTEEPGEVMCAICDKIFCKACIKPFKSLHFCKEHIPLIMRHDWDEVITIKTSTSDPEQGVRLYDIKKELFTKDELPTYIETHYKINVDHDYIETYLVLFAIRENLDLVKSKISI